MEKQVIKYRVLDFTEFPGPRYVTQGEDSGELFYEKILKPQFEEIQKSKEKGNHIILEVNLDSTAGYASSFLDEAFGNISYDFGQDFTTEHLRIVSQEEPDWIQIIFEETIPEWHRKKINGVPRKPDFLTKE